MNSGRQYLINYSNSILIILLLNIVFYSPDCISQDQAKADSIEKIYNSNRKAKKDLEILKGLTINTTDPNKKLKFADELIAVAKQKDSITYIFTGLTQKGHARISQGDFSEALDIYFQAAGFARTKEEQALIKVTLGDVYSLTRNHDRSISYYNEAIEIFRNTGNLENLGSVLFNAADQYLKDDQIEKSILYLKEAEDIFKEIDYDLGLAYSLGTLGLAYARQGRNIEAEENLQQAIQSLEKVEDYAPICEFLNGMSDIYFEKKEDSIALEYAMLSRDLSKAYGFKNETSEANLRLSNIYESTGDTEEAFKYYKEYITYRDSTLNVEIAQNMSGLRADYEVSQKQAEIDLLAEKGKNQQLVVISIGVASFLICLLAFGLYRRNRFIKKTSSIIEKERNRSDKLLLNILPAETAKELKKNGRVKAKKFASVTVLFADFKRFTLVAEKLPPERLIKTIDYYFSQFDRIMEKYGIEKIKTIGDSYMAASGLPFPTHDHASRIIKAAFEMTEFVRETKEKSLFDDADFEVRIGLNSGPVVAGVVGIKKFAYDIWGDTVNIASRMESHSEIGKVNISENTYALVKDEFPCEYRGEVEVKNNRLLKMYYVERRKENMEQEDAKSMVGNS